MKRTTAVAGVVGLATGLGLGITGIAGAVDSKPTPEPKMSADRPHPRLDALRQDKKKHKGGLVTAVTATSVTVATPRGSKTIALDAATRYFVGKNAASHAALHVGEVVGITLTDPAALVAKRVVVLPAHLRGLVTEIDGTTLTIVDRDGFTRTIRTTGAVTVKKGQFVVAVGTVDADGTTLDATSVQVLKKRARHR
jgi:hypothetical protein